MANGKKSGKKANVTRRNNLARRRGRNFEWRVARHLDGVPWPGQDGDVEAQGWRIECKYTARWKYVHRLPDWIAQAQGYAKKWPEGKKWALAITGGFRSGVYYVVPEEFFKEMIGVDNGT